MNATDRADPGESRTVAEALGVLLALADAIEDRTATLRQSGHAETAQAADVLHLLAVMLSDTVWQVDQALTEAG